MDIMDAGMFSEDFGVITDNEIDMLRRNESPIPLLEDVDGELTFRRDNLEKLFESEALNNKPIAVISIAGAMRLGKSFLLNLFLHYLRTKGWEKRDDEWLRDWSSRKNPGFDWRGGDEGHTRGIVAWGEPIVVERPRDGQKMAVILLDTQGSFENGRTMEENIRVFAVSTLFSSLQFFNVHKQILTSDMEYLQCFVEFGKAFGRDKVETNIDTGNYESCPDRYFQDIGFLIRDWANPAKYYYGGEGGEQYMNSFMSKGTDIQNEVKKYLRNTFRNIKCFLMPEPGENVRVAKEDRPEITAEG